MRVFFFNILAILNIYQLILILLWQKQDYKDSDWKRVHLTSYRMMKTFTLNLSIQPHATGFLLFRFCFMLLNYFFGIYPIYVISCKVFYILLLSYIISLIFLYHFSIIF